MEPAFSSPTLNRTITAPMATATVSVPALHLPSIATTTSSSQVPQCGGGGNGCTPRGRILKDGWMEKKGARVKKWRRRYFLLFSDPRELRYFDGEKLKGTIDMEQVKAISKAKQWSKSLDHCYSFELHTPKRVYYISCDSEEEMLSWMSEIRQILTTTTSASRDNHHHHHNHVVTAVGEAWDTTEVRTARAGSVSGSESGGESDEPAGQGGGRPRPGCDGGGVRIYLAPRDEDEDEEASESEGMDESEILPESGELPSASASAGGHAAGFRKPRTFPKEGGGGGWNQPGRRDTLTDHDRLPAVKAIILDSLIMCQMKLMEDRKHFRENAGAMSKEELIALVKQLKSLNEGLGLGSSLSGSRTARP